jgi:Xaa-Pro dipeptidase
LDPGATAGSAFAAARKVKVADECGFGDILSGRSGYTTGIGISPSWVQRMSINTVPGNDTVLEPGMVFRVCTVLQMPNVFGVGESSTVMITETGLENLTADMEAGPFLIE